MLSEQRILKERYQLIHLLAQNASQQTWSAIDDKSPGHDRVIVKLLAMNPETGWVQAKLLEREGHVLGKLSHSRIPKYRDYFILENLEGSRFPWFCLAQDQVDGKSLQQLLNEGYRFTELEIESIAIEILEVLSYLHHFDPPILHRDLKPSNLIRDENGHIHIIDFGAVQDQAALDGVTFTVVGTYGYVPMEQFGGRAVPASDLYSLGMTLIHLMTGVSPTDLPHENNRIQFASLVGVDRAFVNWIEKLIEPYVADRTATADLALDAFHNRSNLISFSQQNKPKGSRIKLQKSMSQLSLDIPPKARKSLFNRRFFGSFTVAIASACHVALFFLSKSKTNGFLLLLLMLFLCRYMYELIAIILQAVRRTTINMNLSHFTLSYSLLGFTYWKRCEIITKIEVCPYVMSTGLQIKINGKEFWMSQVASVEQRWLIPELADWIEMHSDSQSS
jgi:serine/threonine protein kinase